MPWQKGQSGNPNGRPGKDRALTALLETAGGRRVDGFVGVDGESPEKVIRQRAAVNHIWNLAAFGMTDFGPHRDRMYIGAQSYVDLVKWLFTQIDGPAPTQLQHSSDPERPLTIRVEYDDPEPVPALRAGAHAALTAATLLPGADGSGGEAV